MNRGQMKGKQATLLVASFLGCQVAQYPAHADPLFAILGVSALRQFHEAKHFTGSNNVTILRQTSEVTCGPAAVASLLKFYFSDNTTEDEMAQLAGTFKTGTSTLLGLRNACRAKGYDASGYRMTLPQLMSEVETSGVPVLVHFKNPSMHYALVIGQADGFILVSDPAQGNLSMDEADFLRRWDGNALVVKSQRPANRVLVDERKQSAETRLRTLNQVGRSITIPRF